MKHYHGSGWRDSNEGCLISTGLFILGVVGLVIYAVLSSR